MNRTQSSNLITLDADHPGFRDRDYRARRDRIAQAALDYLPGDPLPLVDYTLEEQQVWSTVCAALRPLHEEWACQDVLRLLRALDLGSGRVPQFVELNRLLRIASGFTLEPVAGLVSPRAFLERLAEGVFLSTQYLRHPSAPLYTPEPDLLHEVVGHVSTLCDSRFANLHRRFGEAALRSTEEELSHIERLYWWTLEFGVVHENGMWKAVGAGLLSSPGELARLEDEAQVVPLDLDLAARTPFDPTGYQPFLFGASSTAELLESVENRLSRR